MLMHWRELFRRFDQFRINPMEDPFVSRRPTIGAQSGLARISHTRASASPTDFAIAREARGGTETNLAIQQAACAARCWTHRASGITYCIAKFVPPTGSRFGGRPSAPRPLARRPALPAGRGLSDRLPKTR